MGKKTWVARLYLGRDESGAQQFKWVGRFDTKRERDKALGEARLEHERGGSLDLPTCDAYVDRYLAEYEGRNKDSSYATQTQRLKPFKDDFAGRSLDISREEAKRWLAGEGWEEPQPKGNTPALVSLYNYAIDEDDLPLERNPFRKLSHRSKGRSELDPPTEAEFAKLLSAAEGLGTYGRTLKAMLQFSAFTLMRPGELFPLEWTDLDFKAMRIRKARRLYAGALDEPKTGPKTIALTPPARDAIMGLPRTSNYIFLSKTGKRYSQAMLSTYWANVLSASGLDFQFYLAAKHYGVHYMWRTLGMSEAAIAAQAGWEPTAVSKLLKVYGHFEVGALDEVDKAFRNAPKPKLTAIQGGKNGR